MKRSPRPRTTAELSKSLQQPLNMYALAASAAGVSVLALSQPSDAKIVYTPTHSMIDPHETFRLDVNHDGSTDFTFRNYIRTFGNFENLLFALVEQAAPGNGVEGGGTRGNGFTLASALNRGSRIPGGQRFCNGTAALAYVWRVDSSSGDYGKWVNVTNRYLGFRFQIKGRTHYGWARLNVQVNVKKRLVTATVTGYAYETIPNKPIIAGKTKGPDVITVQPASLGHLAAGASAIPAWRSGK